MSKKMNGIARSRADKAFDTLDYVFLTIAFLLVAYPLYFVVIASVSDPIAVYEGRVVLYPIKPTLEGYRRILSYSSLFVGYKNTIIYTLVGTSINVVLTITAGYALSRKELVGRNVMMMGVMITMIISGGMIPNYLLVRNLRLYNTMWALILPGAVSTWNLIVNTLDDMVNDVATQAAQQRMGDLIKYGMIIVSSLPLLILYPFLQKYFVQGVMIGAIKG